MHLMKTEVKDTKIRFDGNLLEALPVDLFEPFIGLDAFP